MSNQANSNDPGQASPGAEALGEPALNLRLTAVASGLLEAVRSRPAGVSEKRVIIDWLKTSLRVGGYKDETVLDRYAHELWRVRAEALPHLVKTFLPENFHRRLLGDLKKGLEHEKDRRISPVELVQIALSSNGNTGGELYQARFMAKRELSLGFYFLWLVTEAEYQGTMEQRYWDQTRKTKNDTERFQVWLQEKGLITGPAERRKVHTAHEPTSPYRCLGITLGRNDEFVRPPQGMIASRAMPDHFVVEVATPSGPVKALFTVRRKGLIQTIAKMALLGIANPRHVPDRRGIRFCFRNKEDLLAGSEFIFGKVGLAFARKERVTEADEAINRHAAANLMVLKDTAGYHDSDIEIQCLLATQHIDLMRSHGDENSVLYHRRQYTDPKGIFPQVFPEDLYVMIWQDPHLGQWMDDHIRESIPK